MKIAPESNPGAATATTGRGGDNQLPDTARSGASEMINKHESFDHFYFDAMEVIYYDDMLQQQTEKSSAESPSTSGEDGTLSKDSENEEYTADQNEKDARGIKRVITKKSSQLHKMAHKRRKVLEDSLLKRRRKIKQIMSEPKFVLTMDKASFVFGVLIILVIEAVLLVAPNQMGKLYTALLIPLMVARYLIYKADLFHYFMYDFCYYVQVILLISMYVYPDNIELEKALFSMANGCLASAIIMWRNSLVFHSMDKMTSMFIHILPPLVTFSQRWGDHLSRKEFPFYEKMEGTIISNMKEFWLIPFGYYILWQTIYLIKTEVISKKKLEYNTEMMTSLRWMTRKKSSSSYKLLSIFGEHNQLPTFVLIQAVYTFITFLIVPLLWHSFWLHSLYLAAIFIVSLANGASYYFHVFAKRYIEEIQKRVSEEHAQTNDQAKS